MATTLDAGSEAIDFSPPCASGGFGASYGTIALIGLVSLLVRLPYLGDPAADYDEQLYSLIGQRWLDGLLPYADLWDRKPPGLFALYAAIHWIGGPGAMAYCVAGLAATFAAGVLLYRLARPLGTHLGALTVTLLFLINLPQFLVHLGQSETFLLPILLALALLFRQAFAAERFERARNLILGAMLLGGVALQIKYSIAPFCVAMACLAWYCLARFRPDVRRILTTMGLFGIAGLLPTLIAAAYFAYEGAFADFFFANFVSIFERGEMAHPLVREFRTHLIVAASPLVVYAVLGVRELHRARRVRNHDTAIYLTFALAGTVSLFMLGNAFVHYFAPLLPFLVLLATPFFSFHQSGRLFAACAVLLAAYSADFPEQIERTTSSRAAIPALTAAIVSHVPESECLFVFDGPAALYSSTRRCIPSRLVFPDHFLNLREANALVLDPVAETRRVLATRPGAIVVTDHMDIPIYNPVTVGMVKEALTRDYVFVRRAFLYPTQVEVFVRRDLLTERALPRARHR